jgi:hypothetical protein
MITPPLCPYEISVPAYLLAALEPAEWGDVHRHVQTCLTCQSEIAELANLLGLLTRLRFDVRNMPRTPPLGIRRPPASSN